MNQSIIINQALNEKESARIIEAPNGPKIVEVISDIYEKQQFKGESHIIGADNHMSYVVNRYDTYIIDAGAVARVTRADLRNLINHMEELWTKYRKGNGR